MRLFKKHYLIFLIFFSLLNAEVPNNKIRVALFDDKGANPRNLLVAALETAPDMSFSMINGEELREGELKGFDVLLVPGGSAQRESLSMQAEGRNEVRRFVGEGGIYMGICAGCYLLTQAKPTDLGLLPLDTKDKANWQRGKGLLPVELTPEGNEIFGTNQKVLEILYHNGPVIDTSHITPEAGFIPLGFYRGELVKHGAKHGLMANTPAMFLGRFGKGLVLGISPHPEANPNQVNMELNAIRWLYIHRTK